MAIELKSYRSRLMGKLLIPSEAKHYINAAFADSTEMFFEAIKDVAQAHQMASVAKKSGVTRESLYRSLSKRGNPSWKTVLSVLKVVGLRIPGVEEIGSSAVTVASSRRKTVQVSVPSKPHGYDVISLSQNVRAEPATRLVFAHQETATNKNWHDWSVTFSNHPSPESEPQLDAYLSAHLNARNNGRDKTQDFKY
jgi:probable addiction module antidote protein